MSNRLLEPPLRPRPARGILAGLGALLLGGTWLGLGLPACSADADRDPMLREPALLIDAAALERLLDRTRTLAGTPAGSASMRLLERLNGCPEIAAHFAPSTPNDSDSAPASRLERLVCRDERSLDPRLAEALERERGEHAGILQWPIGETGRLALVVDVDPSGGLVVGGVLEPSEDRDAGSLLIPAALAPGNAAIDDAASLVHLHLRPAAGLRLAELIPQGSQGDRLFALKGRLLEGALLEGTLEFAFLPPATGGSVPLAVVALHHRAAAPIEAALDEALDQLERTWGIVRTARRFAVAGGGERSGGCYADLPILPELAPCWVVTEKVLLVGYRPEALEVALQTGSDPGEATSRLVIDLDRVRSVDAALAPSAAMGLAELYSRLELTGRTGADGRVALEGLLRARN